MRYGVIQNGMCVNVIIWDGTGDAPYDSTYTLVASPNADVGMVYNSATGQFSPPTPAE